MLNIYFRTTQMNISSITRRSWPNTFLSIPFPHCCLFVHLVLTTVFLMSAPYISTMWVASNSPHMGHIRVPLSSSLLSASNPQAALRQSSVFRLGYNKIYDTVAPPTMHHIISRPEIASEYRVCATYNTVSSSPSQPMHVQIYRAPDQPNCM
jgi:hypothetical protein